MILTNLKRKPTVSSVNKIQQWQNDLVLTDGNIYTVSEKQPKAEAIAVKGDRIGRLERPEAYRHQRREHLAEVIAKWKKDLVRPRWAGECDIFTIDAPSN